MNAKKIFAALAAAAIGATLIAVPIASADTDPTVASGTDSYSQYQPSYHATNSPSGRVDQAF